MVWGVKEPGVYMRVLFLSLTGSFSDSRSESFFCRRLSADRLIVASSVTSIGLIRFDAVSFGNACRRTLENCRVSCLLNMERPIFSTISEHCGALERGRYKSWLLSQETPSSAGFTRLSDGLPPLPRVFLTFGICFCKLLTPTKTCTVPSVPLLTSTIYPYKHFNS